ENGREVIVRVNDRGPFVNDRIIDMSKRSADQLGFRGRGKTRAHVQYIGPAPLQDPTYGHLAAMNEELKRRTPLNEMIAGANLRDGRYGENQPPRRAAQAATTSNTGAGGYYIQVAAFADPGNAQRTKEALADLGSVQIKPANGSFGPLYRVRVGPLDNHATAQSALEQVRARGHHDAVVNSAVN
ncbi:MAG: SPOR domain-containing protein, partial [Pseudomonadota bacterium]